MIALGTLAVGVLGGVTALIACLIKLAF